MRVMNEATILLKEKGANSLPEANFCSPLKADATCAKILTEER